MSLMTHSIELSIQCARCGEGRVALRADVRDDAPVHCPSCSAALGTWGEVREEARAAVFDALRDDFRTVVSAAAPNALAA